MCLCGLNDLMHVKYLEQGLEHKGCSEGFPVFLRIQILSLAMAGLKL